MTINIVSLTPITSNTGTSVYGVQNSKIALVGVNGTYTGFQFKFQGSTDNGLTWDDLAVIKALDFSLVTGTIIPGTNAVLAWFVSTNGVTHIRLKASALSTGSVNITVTESDTYGITNLPLQLSMQGAAGSLTNAWPVKITDGVNGVASLEGSGNPAASTDTSLIVGLSPNSPLSDGFNNFIRTGAAIWLTAGAPGQSAVLATPPGQWGVTNSPAVNNAASASKAAGGPGIRHICTSVSFAIFSDATGGTPFLGTVNLRDGATGAGTILQTWIIGNQTAACAGETFSLSGLNIFGSTNTAMTLEFTAAGGAHTAQSVAMSGYDTV